MSVNFGFDGEKATGSAPSGFRKYRDTFAIQSPLRASESTVETNSLVSETESAIPELTTAEERAIRLSGALFAPIQSTPDIVITPATVNLARQSQQSDISDVMSWKPSDDITRCIEGKSGPRHTREWDNDGIEVIEDENQPRVDLIPTQTRQSTPESILGTGTFVINRRDNQPAVEFSRTNLQEHAGQNGHQGKLPSMKIKGGFGVSMRHVVQIENRNVTENNSVTSPDNVQLRPANPDEIDGALERKMNAENKGTSILVPKMIIFVIAVMILIAGIVALIVNFKKSENEGSKVMILPNPIVHAECPDVSVKLGESVNFTCRFDLTHDLRKSLVAYKKFKIVPMNRIVSSACLTFNQISTIGNSFLNILFTNDVCKARCSTEGRYYVHLYDRKDTLLHTANVSIKLKSSVLNTSFEQHLEDNCNEVKTYFESTCSIIGDCRAYEPSIVRMSNRRAESLNHLMTCQRNFTDESGYSVTCKANISEDLILDNTHLRCRMTSSEQRLERDFVLPECSTTPSCLKVIRENQYPFNCSKESTHYKRLLSASCNFGALRNCLQEGLKVFDLYKDSKGDLSCRNMTETVPVCRLSWCTDYRYIVKYLVPGQLICGGEFLEEEYTPPPTTTTQNTLRRR